MNVRRSDKQTHTVIAHIVSIVNKIAKDGKPCIFMSFGVKKQKWTLNAYGIANIVPNKKDNA